MVPFAGGFAWLGGFASLQGKKELFDGLRRVLGSLGRAVKKRARSKILIFFLSSYFLSFFLSQKYWLPVFLPPLHPILRLSFMPPLFFGRFFTVAFPNIMIRAASLGKTFFCKCASSPLYKHDEVFTNDICKYFIIWNVYIISLAMANIRNHLSFSAFASRSRSHLTIFVLDFESRSKN